MTAASGTSRSDDRALIAVRLRRVSRARQSLDLGRHVGVRQFEQRDLEDELLAALEGYAAAITASGAPVSRRLRAEITLYQGLGDR